MGGCRLIHLTENCGLLLRRYTNLSFVKDNVYIYIYFCKVTYFQVLRRTLPCEIRPFSAQTVAVCDSATGPISQSVSQSVLHYTVVRPLPAERQ